MTITDAQLDAALPRIDRQIKLAQRRARLERRPVLVAMHESGDVSIVGPGQRATGADLQILAHVREDEVVAAHPRLLAAFRRPRGDLAVA